MQPRKAPDPVSAVWESLANRLTVTFDQPLLHLPTQSENWWVFDGFIRHQLRFAFGQALGKTVTVVLSAGIASLVPPQVVYFAAPADVIGRNGLPVAAFSGFPVTII